MDVTALQTELNIRIGDTDNFAFTTDEKAAIVKEAMKDAYVVKTVWDTTLTFDTDTYQYTRPSALTTVKDIYIRPASTDEPEKIDAKLWEVVGSNIQFKNYARNVIPDGNTLFLKGNYKFTIADTISEINVQEYVLNLAHSKLLKTLATKRAFRFLKNDTTMSEIIAFKRELEAEVEAYRRRLPREYELA